MEKQMEKQFHMLFISYDKLWHSEFYNNVSAKDKVQDLHRN